MLAYKLSGNPSKGCTDDSTVSLADGLLLTIPVKPTEIRAANENEWPGPGDLIARAAFINTSNEGVTPPSGTEWTRDIETMKEFLSDLQHYKLLLFSDTAKQFIYTRGA